MRGWFISFIYLTGGTYYTTYISHTLFKQHFTTLRLALIKAKYIGVTNNYLHGRGRSLVFLYLYYDIISLQKQYEHFDII